MSQPTQNIIWDPTLDSNCAIYHFLNNLPSYLINLGLPNKSSAESILEAIDAKLGILGPGPLSTTETESISILLGDTGHKKITPVLKISEQSGNTAVLENDGLYVPISENIYKVKADPSFAPYYLKDVLFGGTDGVISLSVDQAGDILTAIPSLNPFSLVSSIVKNAAAVTNLSSSIVNAVTHNSTFLQSLTRAIENNILNDSTFITNLTKEVLANPAAFADLCAALANCSGTTACPCPNLISSAIGIESSGNTAIITLNFIPPVPTPVDYVVKYRLKGTTDYTTLSGFKSSPIQIFGVPIGDYEGLLFSECSGATYVTGTTLCPSGTTWTADLSCSGTTGVPYSFILGNSCTADPTTLYTNGTFHIGTILYVDPGLTTRLTGWGQVVYQGIIYNVSVSTGEVLSIAGSCPIQPNFIFEDLQTTGTQARYVQPGGITGFASPVAGTYTNSPYFDGVFNTSLSTTVSKVDVAKYSRYQAGSNSAIITVVLNCSNCGSGTCICAFANVNLYVNGVLVQTIVSNNQGNTDTVSFLPIDTSNPNNVIKITLTDHV